MPKIKSSKASNINKYVAQYKDIFKTDGSILFCKICNKSVSFGKKFQVDQHLKSTKHKELSDRQAASSSQSLLPTAANNVTSNQFYMDLCEAFMASDIPLRKLSNPNLIEFFKKYTTEIIPRDSTLRKNYVNKLYDSHLKDIKAKLKDQFLWVSIDETIDIQGRFVANVIVGVLHKDEHASKQKFLLNVVELEKTNHSTIARAFNDSLNILGEDFDKTNVLLYLTDAAPYMVKSGQGLKLFYPKLIHITCLAHAMHRIAEEIRSIFEDVDDLVSNGKKIFLKAPTRVEAFKSKYPEIALPPAPVITRWGTWIEAVRYYSENFQFLEAVVKDFDDSDACSIKKTKDALNTVSIKQHLAFIDANYGFIPDTIRKLEGRSSLKQNIKLVEDAVRKIQAVDGEYGCKVKNKLKSVLGKNKGFEEIKNISNIIDTGKENLLFEDYSPTEIASLKYAPITSVDVERSFSLFKNFFRANRTCFTFENLKKQFIIYANKAMNEDANTINIENL